MSAISPVDLSTRRVLLIGCGRMGNALLNGWLEKGLAPHNAFVVTPHPNLPPGVNALGVGDAIALSPPPDVCVIAVKPQKLAQVLPAYAPLADQGTVFLSVAVGQTFAGLHTLLGKGACLVRTMPNTPSAIGMGISGMVAEPTCPKAARDLCDALMGAVGETAWLDDESQMDALSALSGSGPAYVFWLVEAMAQAGASCGLSAGLSMKLARQTVIGSGALLAASPDDSAALLRQNVTSPGGTTAAALGVLMDQDHGFGPLMVDAFAAAIKRARELAA